MGPLRKAIEESEAKTSSFLGSILCQFKVKWLFDPFVRTYSAGVQIPPQPFDRGGLLANWGISLEDDDEQTWQLYVRRTTRTIRDILVKKKLLARGNPFRVGSSDGGGGGGGGINGPALPRCRARGGGCKEDGGGGLSPTQQQHSGSALPIRGKTGQTEQPRPAAE